jgi:indole-3-glycerol phosphate synthase
MNFLTNIINYKKKKLILDKSNLLVNKFLHNSNKKSLFKKKILNNIKNNKISIIAELKKSSPSKGILTKNFNIMNIAKQYIEGGATCLSVLTENNFFLGNKNYIKQIKEIHNIPILAKDFFIDPFQVYEAKFYGADCILILLSAVSKKIANDLYKAANQCGMDTIIEVHDSEELAFALTFKNSMIGINNRNLKTFSTDINNTVRLYKKFNLKKRVVISESGFSSKKEISYVCKKTNIRTFLIGESLIKSNGIADKIRSFSKK